MKDRTYRILVHRGIGHAGEFWEWSITEDRREIGRGEEREPIDALESAAVFLGFHLDFFPDRPPGGIVAEVVLLGASARGAGQGKEEVME